jgi:putative FmdB family regulatory protein
VLSWLFLRGRCSACQAPISPRYPLVETSSGLLSAFAAFHFGYGWPAAGAMLLIWCLIALTCVDFDSHLLPDSITLPLLWAGLLFNLFDTFTDLQSAVIGAVAGYLCAVVGLLGVQADDRQGGHGLRRFQAARCARRLAGLGDAAADHSALVTARRGGRHRADRGRQTRAPYPDPFRPLPGGGGSAGAVLGQAADAAPTSVCSSRPASACVLGGTAKASPLSRIMIVFPVLSEGLVMPIYAYRCTSCGFERDHLQKLSDPLLELCPQCGEATIASR